MGPSPATVGVLVQPDGLLHRYNRDRHVENIVERPERLQAVCVGLAAATALMQHESSTTSHATSGPEGLADVLKSFHIDASQSSLASGAGVRFMTASTASRAILRSEAVKLVHGEEAEYLGKLESWAEGSEDAIRAGRSEIPEGLPQGDLYLCPQSIDAIAGAASAVCEAVDLVIQSSRLRQNPLSSESASGDATPHQIPPLASSSSPKSDITRTFVAIRPPGHHCSNDTPSGFCFVNNVLIGAAHAHIKHNVSRVLIFDIDLHHGNGSQAIAWKLNAEADRLKSESEARVSAGLPPRKDGLRVYYSSLHDILSFPCEDGDAALVQAASTNLSGAHAQWITNVHLEPYSSNDEFYDKLYPVYKEKLLGTAQRFLDATAQSQNGDDDALIFISAGFDASPHEYSSMSRHGRHVPTSFYQRFTSDVVKFAESQSALKGRVVSVLEGGYSDAALISGSGALLRGLAGAGNDDDVVPDGVADDEALWRVRSKMEEEIWNADVLDRLEDFVDFPLSLTLLSPIIFPSTPKWDWLAHTRKILLSTTHLAPFFEPLPPLSNLRPPKSKMNTPTPSTMTLRDRKKPAAPASEPTETKAPKAKKGRKSAGASASTSKKPVSSNAAAPPVPPVLKTTSGATAGKNDPSSHSEGSMLAISAIPSLPQSTSHAPPPDEASHTAAEAIAIQSANSGPDKLMIRIRKPPSAGP